MTATFTAPKADYKAIGKSPMGHDGVGKVTGKALYGADMKLPGLLFGKVLRSPHAHARIKSIDYSKAESFPGVMAVATSKQFANLPGKSSAGNEVRTNIHKYLRDNVLAGDKVLYVGHAVAAVAAVSPHVAEEALKLIEVEYEVLPAVTNGEDAMEAASPILHQGMVADGAGGEAASGTNIAGHEQISLGDVPKGFNDAAIVLERGYRTSTVHQGYIEPHNATAMWDLDGRLTIWCSTQAPFEARDNTAQILGMPVSKVKIMPMEIGGGFGGKLAIYLEPVAAVLSKLSGKPVKMTMTHTEVLEASGPTSGSFVKVRLGVSRERRITAAQAHLVFEAGAYPGAPISFAMATMFTPYDIPNVLIDGYDVLVNKPKTAPYRAPGAPIGAFAVESLIDEVSGYLGMDPIEFRLLNAAREGTRRAVGTCNPPIGVEEVMEAVKAHPHYRSALGGKYRGRGVAVGFWRNNTGAAAAVASVVPDGTVFLVEGSVDMGGSRIVIAQQLAEALGIPVEAVKLQVADTDTIGYTSSTSGSGATFKTGWAVYQVAQDIKGQLVERAALLWESAPEEFEYSDGAVRHKLDPESTLTFKRLAARLNDTGGPVIGRAGVNPGGVGGSCTATIVDVDVDPDTGKVQILRCTAFQDAGKAIHPANVEGQMQGGTAQGIGWALHEEYFMSEEGRLLNSSVLDYRIPTAMDLPSIDTVIVEVPNPGHPFGVRGVGEGSIIPPLAAVANAISHALGIRMNRLPLKPADLLQASPTDKANRKRLQWLRVF